MRNAILSLLAALLLPALSAAGEMQTVTILRFESGKFWRNKP